MKYKTSVYPKDVTQTKSHTAFEFLILIFSYKSSRSLQIPSLVKEWQGYIQKTLGHLSDIWKYKKIYSRKRLSTISEKRELELGE